MSNALQKVTRLIAIIFILTACTSHQPQWFVISGSKADGVVTLGYDYGLFKNPDPNLLEAGVPLARGYCQAWGFSSAAPFGGDFRRCDDEWDCFPGQVAAVYQCLE